MSRTLPSIQPTLPFPQRPQGIDLRRPAGRQVGSEHRQRGAAGFTRIEALRDAVDALHSSDEAKRRFEIMARQVFMRFKALLMEPSAFTYAERHDNLEAIYKKLQEKRDIADVTEVLKELHRIVNEAIRTAASGQSLAEGLTVDLSRIDFDRTTGSRATSTKKQGSRL